MWCWPSLPWTLTSGESLPVASAPWISNGFRSHLGILLAITVLFRWGDVLTTFRGYQWVGEKVLPIERALQLGWVTARFAASPAAQADQERSSRFGGLAPWLAWGR